MSTPNDNSFRTERGGIILFPTIAGVRRNAGTLATEIILSNGSTMLFRMPEDEHLSFLNKLTIWSTGL